jgi:hypothetical protein
MILVLRQKTTPEAIRTRAIANRLLEMAGLA